MLAFCCRWCESGMRGLRLAGDGRVERMREGRTSRQLVGTWVDCRLRGLKGWRKQTDEEVLVGVLVWFAIGRLPRGW